MRGVQWGEQEMRLLGVLAVSCVVGACSSVVPDPGVEAVLTRKPILFGHGGVDPTPIKTGRSFVAWTTTATYVNMQPQRVDMQFDDLMTSNGVPIDFHAVFSYRVVDSVKLVNDFGADHISNAGPGFFVRNLDQPFRTAVRDAVKKREMQAMAITASAAEEVDTEVTRHMESLIKSTGVPILLIDLSLGRANPPDAIKTQRVDTATQEQRIITEQQRKLAEDQRKLAEQSRAEADAAYNLRMNAAGGASLPPELSLRLREIEMKREVCARSNCTFWFGDAPTPVVNVAR
jgi:regulator of protease activity HflC (stomatin/prohibitin superfamily)